MLARGFYFADSVRVIVEAPPRGKLVPVDDERRCAVSAPSDCKGVTVNDYLSVDNFRFGRYQTM